MAKLDENDESIKVGIIGAGTFGTQIIVRICHMQGMRIAAAADLAVDRAIDALQLGGISKETIVCCETSSSINDAMRRREFAVSADPDALIASDVDVVIEATGNAEVGAYHGLLDIPHDRVERAPLPNKQNRHRIGNPDVRGPFDRLRHHARPDALETGTK